jgi:hypothetical protein
MTPEGVADISRWLSGAKPPVADVPVQNDPGGVAETSLFHSRYLQIISDSRLFQQPFQFLDKTLTPMMIRLMAMYFFTSPHTVGRPFGVFGDCGFRVRCLLRPLRGRMKYYGRFSGGFAALNHRLMAATPPGSKTANS